MNRYNLLACAALAAGVACGGWFLDRPSVKTAAASPKSEARLSDPAHNVGSLMSRLAMVMADYHTTNLWFAGRAGNWPLADYYWREVEAHIDLSAKSDPTGQMQARLERIVKAIDDSPTMQVPEAIAAQDARAFAAAYRGLLVGCYDCHKAVGMAYLRPQMPVRPHRSIINVDPKATWPQ